MRWTRPMRELIRCYSTEHREQSTHWCGVQHGQKQTRGMEVMEAMEAMEQGLEGSGHLWMQPPAWCMATGRSIWPGKAMRGHERPRRSPSRELAYARPAARRRDIPWRRVGALLFEIKRDVTTAFGIESQKQAVGLSEDEREEEASP